MYALDLCTFAIADCAINFFGFQTMVHLLGICVLFGDDFGFRRYTHLRCKFHTTTNPCSYQEFKLKFSVHNDFEAVALDKTCFSS